MKVLTRTQFGNPILREIARELTQAEITSAKVQQLIADMRHTLTHKKLGIGLAAPQVGERIALAVIAIRPTKLRPKIEPFDLTLINPVITEANGRRKKMWEGCISAGSNGTADLFAQVPRYSQITVEYLDENGKSQSKSLKGLQAHVVQHEVDHLNGILFVDRVKDPKTFMTYKEYVKRVKKHQKADKK